MSDSIIRVENLGKRYRIRHQQQGHRYVALRDVLASKLASPLQWFCQGKSFQSNTREDFWALKDVSFEVKQGEVVGIIGVMAPVRALCSRSLAGSPSRRKVG